MTELNKKTESLLKLLADGEFHSGQKVGELLGVSRAAISKHIGTLQDLGLDIHRVTGKGYRLSSPLSLLDKNLIAEFANNDAIEVHTVIDSTNKKLMGELNALKKGHVCIAECQTAGKGRRGRTWVSPMGSHLYLSMYWNLESGMSAAMGLSLVAGIAVVNALASLGVDGVGLKWPNDVYASGKKLAGILVEMSAQVQGPCQLVIGVGLNVKMPEQAASQIDQPWIDLNTLTLNEVDRNQLAGRLIESLILSLRHYEEDGLQAFTQRWNELDAFVGKSIKLVVGTKEEWGICRGIDDSGAVLLDQHGLVKPYIGGEISLRSGD